MPSWADDGFHYCLWISLHHQVPLVYVDFKYNNMQAAKLECRYAPIYSMLCDKLLVKIYYMHIKICYFLIMEKSGANMFMHLIFFLE